MSGGVESVKTHGRSGYTRGCRCDLCSVANSAWSREYARRRNRRRGVARVSARASRDRLRALAWMGWSTRELAKLYAVSGRTLDTVRAGSGDTVMPDTHDMVHRIFEDLCLTKGPEPGASIVRAAARKHKWPSPLSIERQES